MFPLMQCHRDFFFRNSLIILIDFCFTENPDTTKCVMHTTPHCRPLISTRKITTSFESFEKYKHLEGDSGADPGFS